MPRSRVRSTGLYKDQAHILDVPELPGCAADGRSYHEAITNVEDVIDDWIETVLPAGTDLESRTHRVDLVP